MNKIKVTSLVALLGLSGCVGIKTTQEEIVVKTEQKARVFDAALNPVAAPRLSVNNSVVLPVGKVNEKKTSHWLSTKKVSLEIKNPVPLSEVVKMLWSNGINISSDLPLNSYTYSGNGVNSTNAETAIQMILGALGLDYKIDDERQTVLVVPMASKTWYLNLGNRKSSFSSGSIQTGTTASSGSTGPSSGASSTSMSGSSGSGSSGQSAYSGGTSGGAGGGTAAAASASNAPANGTGMSISDDFWSSLSSELGSRLNVMLPTAAPTHGIPNVGMPIPGMAYSPGMPIPQMSPGGALIGNTGAPIQTPFVGQTGYMGMPQQPLGQNMLGGVGVNAAKPAETFSKKQIGSYSINAETGSVTVQAPHWLLKDIDSYLTRVTEMYNTDITFSCELVMVTSDASRSEGLDISAFGAFAKNKYGAAYSNNALGGVTVSFPSATSNIPSIAAGGAAIAGTMLGFTSAVDGLKVFNAYLSNQGKVSVIQRPVVSTTSGVPGSFSKIVTQYYNSVSQQAAAGGTGSAAVGTQNTLVPVNLGTSLVINPRFDVSTGLIRAQITLDETLQSGTQTVQQSLTSGGNVAAIPVSIPILTRMVYSGEALLRDGELVVVGGQVDENITTTDSGITGIKDSPLFGGVAGNKASTKQVGTYYFAFKVSVKKR